MRVTETFNEGLKRKLDMSIPAAELNEKLDEKLLELKGRAQIKGFRPGKVPFAHLKKVYGRSAMSEVMREAMNSGIQKILEEREERPALQPKVDLTEDQAALNRMFAGQADLDFSVTYEVLPKVDLMDLASIKIERPLVDVTDAELEEQFRRFVEANRPFEVKDGPAGTGDKATMNFVGRIGGKTFEGGTSEEVDVVIGSGQFLPGFEDQLIGASAGEKRQVTASFPADYSTTELAGKQAEFEVTVSVVAAPSTAEIDDAFAAKLGLGTLAQIRQTIRDQIGLQYLSLTRRRVKRMVLDILDEAHRFEVPQNLVDEEFKTIWERVTHEIEHHGRSFEAEGTTEAEARQEYQRIANRRVRLGLVVAELGTRNDIKVTDEELQQALVAEVQRFPGQEQQVYDYYRQTPAALSSLRAPIFESKVVDFVMSKASVTDKKVSREELVEMVQADRDTLAFENPSHNGPRGHDDEDEHEHEHDHAGHDRDQKGHDHGQ